MCNREAPGVEQFARQNAAKIRVVGLGTQDNLAQARSFRTRHKITGVTMLWDRTGKSWSSLGVVGQPAWMLLRPDGSLVEADYGQIPFEDILKRV